MRTETRVDARARSDFPTTPAADDPDDRATGGQSIQPKT
jgi:hypothetical protein